MAGWSVPGVKHLREVREDPVGRRVMARHRITRRSLAVTYLSDELLADTEFRARFAREFGRLARVRDARVLRVRRYVECPHGAAVVGDHVNGVSLRALLHEHGALGTQAALVVLKDSLRGLATGHAAGLAHGDVKPEGVILTRAGGVRLVDFGLFTTHGRRLLARSTPFYLAPEQWSGHPATSAGDVYAATVTFFECLIGAPPFYADSSADLSAKHEQSLPPIDVIPEPVCELVLRGLAKDPHRRPEARNFLAHVDDVAASAVGIGWEQRGRRELARLLDSRSARSGVSTLARRSGGVGGERRQPVRLTVVVGGALVLAASLASPPLAVILPGGSLFGSDARSPVLAFPEPAQDTSPVRAATNGQLADRAPHAAPAAKAAPAARPLVAEAQPNKELSKAPPIPVANPQTVLEEHPTRDGRRADSVPREETAQPPSPPARACTPMLTAKQLTPEHKSCTPVNSEQSTSGSTPAKRPAPIELPALVEGLTSIQLPAPVELPAPIQISIPVQEKAQPPKDIPTLKDARTQKKADSQKATSTQIPPQRHEQTEWAADSDGERQAEKERSR